MLYLLLGNDTFSKKQFINELAQKHIAKLTDQDQATDLMSALNQSAGDLFGGVTIPRFSDALETLINASDDVLAHAAQSSVPIIITALAVDKRKKDHQRLLKHKAITVKEFFVPETPELPDWIKQQLKQRNQTINDDAVQALVLAVAGQPQQNNFASAPAYDLWQIHNELEKLIAYADGQTITKQHVDDLVTKHTESEAWSIINAIADKKTTQLFQLIENFFSTSDGNDEKAKVIQLTALLAEQFRSILLVQATSSARVSEDVILAKTGWKSGRLFMVKKIAARFNERQVKSLLTKLEHLDIEMKTTSTPPRVLFDMIVSQI